jgi:hypothetical protein
MSWDPLDVRLSMLELANYGDLLSRTLEPIGLAIGEAAERIEEVQRDAPPDDADLFTDDERDIIENLLGTAFVVCQGRVTSVVSAAIDLVKYCSKKGLPFAAYPGEKRAILKLDAPLGAGAAASFTRIQVIDAIANYFKHRDEWKGVDWTKLNETSRRTADIIVAAGLQTGSTGNLRRGAIALGNVDLKSMSVFVSIVDEWTQDVIARTKTALNR